MSVEESERRGVYVKLNKLIIKNFKSIKDLEIELKPGINLLVGPNASGKTNILEAVNFLYKTLVEEAGKTPYLPHTPRYWKPEELVYGMDPGREVVLGINFTVFDGIYRLDIEYLVTYRVVKDTIAPVKHVFDYNNGSVQVSVMPSKIEVSVSKSFYKELNKRLPEIKNKRAVKYIEVFMKQLGISEKIDEKLAYSIQTLMTMPLTDIAMPFAEFFEVRDFILANIPIFSEKHIHELIYPVILNKCDKGCSEENAIFLDTIRLSHFISPGGALKVFRDGIVQNIIFLRHPDIGALREPKPFTGVSRLDERATNLAPLLLNLMGRYGGLPERIGEGIRKLFPGLKIMVRSEFGRAVLMGEENGLLLGPSNLPDGAIKLLSILTAIELNPSILLIDELENSMHVKMLEYVVDRLNSLKQPVLVATHSPIVVDLVDPGRVLVVMKDPVRGTVIERISDPKKLSEKLKELGVSLSDYIFYKKTYGD